jgi:CheY-like chemotaxis protein
MADLKTIIVVDDEPDLLELLADMLEGKEFKVIKATNGKEALKVLQERKDMMGAPMIHAVISDWMMPEMNGIELLSRIRSAGAFSGIPFVLMSGAVTKDQLEPILKSGADGIMLKPFAANVLFEKLQSSVDARASKEIDKILA